MTTLPALPSPIYAYLERFISRARRLALARSIAVAVSIFLAWACFCCAIDRYAHLPAAVRFGAILMGSAFFVFHVGPKTLAMWRNPDWLAAAAAIEERNPHFAQRLITVTSRMLGSANYRGSDDILQRLVRQVDEQISNERATRLIPLRSLVWPLSICSVLLVFTGSLAAMPNIRFRELMERFLDPFSNVPPVTTTQLIVSPGDRDVVQSQPLNIEVQATRLTESSPVLFLSDDDRNWSRLPMVLSSPGHFGFALSGVEKDLHYYVAGGDARSPDFFIRVLRRPAVASFRVQYEYPPYTRLPSTTVTNTDGRLEAPAGTKALLTVTATEPLKSALIIVGNDRFLMNPLPDPHSFQTQLLIRESAKYSLDLITTRDVAGSGPSSMSIRAVPDLPPVVRLARGGDSLRLNPRDIVPVWYEALDDYGLKSLAVRSQVNGQPAAEMPLALWGDRRRQQEVCNFDLATLPLGIGDLVKLSIVATDSAGQSTESQPLAIVIAPRSVDFDAYERIEELHNAAQLAQSLSLQLDDALKARAEADGQKDHQSSVFQSALSRADRAFSSASQTATLLRQSLLRATTRSHWPQLCVALAGWIDSAEIESTAADDAFREGGAAPGMVPQKRESLSRAVETGGRLLSQLYTVEQGEQAQALLADHENLVMTQKRPVPKDDSGRRRFRETVQRMRQDIVAAAGQIGLDPSSSDFDSQLRERIDAEKRAVESAKPVDFVPAAREWSQLLGRDPTQRYGLEGRLSAAAQAEAIRPDADLIRARDLELASRAAVVIATKARTAGKSVARASLSAFVTDMQALQHLHELQQQTNTGADKPEVKNASVAAATAEQDLSRLAGAWLTFTPTAGPGTNPSADDRQKDAENLALQAGAAAAKHDYQKAAALDRSLVQRLESSPHRESAVVPGEADSSSVTGRIEHHQQAVQSEMATAKVLDDLGQEQQRLAASRGAGAAEDLAGKQQKVAEQIATVQQTRQSDPANSNADNGRDRAASAVLNAQEQLSSMPRELAAAQAAATLRREAEARAGAARQSANAAPPDQREAARAAAAEADRAERDAEAALADAMQSIGPKSAQDIADRLEPFAPETDGARAVLLGQLAGALQSLRQGLAGDDAAASDQSANEARQAIEACQRELGSAQDTLCQRDPLVAARWFAKAAADSLSARPPDVSHAKLRQANASAALWRAWDQSIHRAAVERLSDIPSLAAVLDPETAAGGPSTPQQNSKFAAAREWGRLRPQDGSEVNESMHDVDPAGYEESLKLYFEALGKAQEGK